MISLSEKYEGFIECRLCPHHCRLRPDQTGICGVRTNTGDEIELMTYGIISGYALDPVEKKPLYHFFPGTNILSLGSYGCNMKCDFCQNYHISQNVPLQSSRKSVIHRIIKDAKEAENNIGIAFTYNEPVIWFEYVYETAKEAHTGNLKTVIVSNGFIDTDPLRELTSVIDAFNIDLKAFTNEFYNRITGATLEPVKNSLKLIAAAGKHLEITTLIIPGKNDEPGMVEYQTEWIAGELGRSVPFHLSRYFPAYKRDTPSTEASSLLKLYDIARKNLDYVYTGNIRNDSGSDTKCPGCGTTVTERKGYSVIQTNTDRNGRCKTCGNEIYRYFISS
jgi:pyruvate formate lyase activating enzyme